MLLAVDIGNTNICLGCFADKLLVFVARLSTNAALTADEYACKLLETLSLYGVERDSIDGAIVSSVVPPLNTVLKEAIRIAFDISPLAVGPGIKTGMMIQCDDPASVGADLICACVAAHELYGGPALIIDMGTATKMMVIDERGAFIGVSIMAGVTMGLRALAEGTAQLPQVSLECPSSVIGKNTADCMRAGVFFGNASMLDGMIERFAETYGKKLPVIATGGAARMIVPLCKQRITLDENLVIKGLFLLYHKNRRAKGGSSPCISCSESGDK